MTFYAPKSAATSYLHVSNYVKCGVIRKTGST